MTIAVTGATGRLGRLVLDRLRALAPTADLVALARSPAQASALGVPVREADYDRPETLGPALAGVDVLLLVSGNVPSARVAQHRNVIEAARQAGVGRVVYTSGLHADDPRFALGADHLATEAALKASGLAYTILRNGMYTENYTGAIPGALAAGVMVGGVGDGRISSAARVDFAEAAAAVLAGEAHEGRTYELAGDEAWTFADLADEVSRQTGRTIQYVNLPALELVARYTGAGLPERAAQFVAAGHVAASQDLLLDDSRELSRLIGRPTTPLSVSVADTLKLLA